MSNIEMSEIHHNIALRYLQWCTVQSSIPWSTIFSDFKYEERRAKLDLTKQEDLR